MLQTALVGGWYAGLEEHRRQAVANRDLWESLFAPRPRRERLVTFCWVKGHSGDRWNDVVDLLAVEAATTAAAPPALTRAPSVDRAGRPLVVGVCRTVRSCPWN